METARRNGESLAVQALIQGVTMAEAEELARLTPGDMFRDCGACPEMVVLPAGAFMMGQPESELDSDHARPVHQVRIPAPFAVGKYEVTRGEFRQFVEATGHAMSQSCQIWTEGRGSDQEGHHWRKPGFPQTDRHPVVCVNWEDAQAYVHWLSLQSGKQYRLLSESEWEYAARAGSQTRYAWGDRIDQNRANCGECGSRWDGGESAAAVGSFPPNAFGLYDMHGNVKEWVEDCKTWGWDDDGTAYEGAPADGTAWVEVACLWRSRVTRGGGWASPDWKLTSGYRSSESEDHTDNAIGFRVARTLAP